MIKVSDDECDVVSDGDEAEVGVIATPRTMLRHKKDSQTRERSKPGHGDNR